MSEQTRRNILKSGTAALGLLGSATVFGRGAMEICGLTPRQTEGPFYPDRKRTDEDNDLTSLKGSLHKALGDIVSIKGQVLDQNCRPIPSAVVVIWQAAANGRYDHEGDGQNPLPLDDNFQYWGRNVSDPSGQYSFKTVLPGSYSVTSTWTRPPHIHYKVMRRGYRDFVTQLYFAGDPLNAKDRVVQSLRPSERKRVIIPLQKVASNNNHDTYEGQFDLVLEEL